MEGGAGAGAGATEGGDAHFATMQKASSQNHANLKQQMPNQPAQFPSAFDQVQSAHKEAYTAYLQAHTLYLQAQSTYWQAQYLGTLQSSSSSSSQLPPSPPLPPLPPSMSMTPQLSGFGLTSSSNQGPPQQMLNSKPLLSSQLSSPLCSMSMPTQTSASNQVPFSFPLQQKLQHNARNLTENGGKLGLNRMAATTLRPMSTVQPQFSGLMTSASNQDQQMLNLQAQFVDLQAQFKQLSSQPPPAPPPPMSSVSTQTLSSNQVPCAIQ
ncbi:probable serine/threonine-protein kinase samkC [Dioscorea cayenensis subsp. rotundata]|uniref:Probable serine/threonine-protein kinase samkC n=1 Tax=Dioscorea cayennensis subsp. rotundata TaxID=55577 RepID=A0AB40D111_DIOCR|nr:probable serine/threonine-protein kinase samkC [Dioscorea cayenensis subsp. rotundata]